MISFGGKRALLKTWWFLVKQLREMCPKSTLPLTNVVVITPQFKEIWNEQRDNIAIQYPADSMANILACKTILTHQEEENQDILMSLKKAQAHGDIWAWAFLKARSYLMWACSWSANREKKPSNWKEGVPRAFAFLPSYICTIFNLF